MTARETDRIIAARASEEADLVVDVIFEQREELGEELKVVGGASRSWPAPEGTPLLVFGRDDEELIEEMGTVGEYFVEKFPNRKPSEVFDTAFQAGVRFVMRKSLEQSDS